jgi:hypothetical protein
MGVVLCTDAMGVVLCTDAMGVVLCTDVMGVVLCPGAVKAKGKLACSPVDKGVEGVVTLKSSIFFTDRTCA